MLTKCPPLPDSVEPQGEQDRKEDSSRAALLERVVVSAPFSKSPKLREFLLYSAHHSFRGSLDCLTETQIGIEVFKRGANDNPGDDNIVRSYARTLRKRLEEYFEGEGRAERFLLSMPRGTYVLSLVERDLLNLPPQQDPQTPVAPLPELRSAPERSRWPLRGLGLALGLLLVVGAYLLGLRNGHRPRSSAPYAHRFWTAFLNDRQTLIVTTDTGLTVDLGLIQRGVTIQEYVSDVHLAVLAKMHPDLEGWARPIAHRYADFVDVLAVHQMDGTPELASMQPEIRFARDIKPADLEQGNSILFGAGNSNPWVSLFDTNLNYQLSFQPTQRTFQVISRKPRNGEPAIFPYESRTYQRYSYGLFAVRRNTNDTGNVLLLEGVTNSGLQAAIGLLQNETAMEEICSHAIRPDGSLQAAEFLVRTDSVGGAATHSEIIGWRVD